MRAMPLTGLIFILLFAGAATAQDAPGRLSSYFCGTMPGNPVVEVVLLDDADVNLRIRDAFVERLRRKGVTIQEGAALTLTLEIEPVREIEKSKKDESTIELRVTKPNPNLDPQGDVDLRGSVWSNSKSSLIGGRQTGPSTLAINRVRLAASLNRRGDGFCLWQGEAIYELGDGELEPVAMALVPELVGAFGKAVTPRPLKLKTPPPLR